MEFRSALISLTLIAGSLFAVWYFLTRDAFGGELSYDATFNAGGIKWGVQDANWVEFGEEWLVDVTLVGVSGRIEKMQLADVVRILCGGFLTGTAFRPSDKVLRKDVFRVNLQAKVPTKTKTVKNLFKTFIPVHVKNGACLPPSGSTVFPNFPKPLEGWLLTRFEDKKIRANVVTNLVFEMQKEQQSKTEVGFDYQTACDFALKDPYLTRVMSDQKDGNWPPSSILISARKTFSAVILKLWKGGHMQFDVVNGKCLRGKAVKA